MNGLQNAVGGACEGNGTDPRAGRGTRLRAVAVDQLRRKISDGTIAPGRRLVERDLCVLLGVSRTVVREALGQLSGEGYVSDLPRGGYIVAPFDHVTVRSIYEVRETVEARAAALFVQRASDRDRDAVRKTVGRFLRQEQAGEHEVLLVILRELLHHICVGSGNSLFEAILAPMTGRIHTLQVREATSTIRRPIAVEETKTMVEALLGDDPEAAFKASRVRLRNAAAFALADLGRPGLG